VTVSVRQYRAADCAACWAIFHRAVQIGAKDHYSQAQRDAWSPARPELTAENCARLAGMTTLVACAGDGAPVIGFMSLDAAGYLDLAFVDPDHMRCGVGDALHDAVLKVARDRGLMRLTAHASHLAWRFLARNGWTTEGKETIRRRGVLLGRFHMALTLGDPE
jgi:putative acetyltransferase